MVGMLESRRRLVAVVAIGALAAVIIAGAAAAIVTSQAGSKPVSTKPTRVSYVVIPHPDDEFQDWSLIEHAPANYTVVISATEGEQTGYCVPSVYRSAGWQKGKEPPADPVPRGRWTESCAQARIHSWLGFFRDMGKSDPTIPSTLRYAGRKGPFPADGTSICREDTLAPARPCRPGDTVDRRARVWLDTRGRGALVMFDLGDGDLTPAEVTWAVRTVQRHRGALGLDTRLPGREVIGAYANKRDHACFIYAHPDHLAVRAALSHHDFGVRYQAGATCSTDPAADFSRTVSDRSATAAWKINSSGVQVGAFVGNYGWLHSGYYPLDRTGEADLFHTHQAFWRVSFGHGRR
jgi:hypothetical protein